MMTASVKAMQNAVVAPIARWSGRAYGRDWGSTTAVSAGLAGVRLGPVPSARRLDKCLEVRGLDPPETANFAPRQFAGAEPVLQRFRTQLEDGRGLFDR
jgi:hypothetical protein